MHRPILLLLLFASICFARATQNDQPRRVRVGGQVQSALAVGRAQPIYPPQAKDARIQGVVRLDAVIDDRGAVKSLQVISGHPLLVPAAIDAVRQWTYKPTILNGAPVEVATTIDVNFTLDDAPAQAMLFRVSPPPEISDRATAERVEEALRGNPEDIRARGLLLRYYASNPQELDASIVVAARRSLISWLVQHHPEAQEAGSFEAWITRAGGKYPDAEGYEQVKRVWLEQVERHSGEVRVLMNAADFLQTADKELAESILLRGQALHREASGWASRLGSLYALGILGVTRVGPGGQALESDPEQKKGAFASKARLELQSAVDPIMMQSAAIVFMRSGAALKDSSEMELAKELNARASQK